MDSDQAVRFRQTIALCPLPHVDADPEDYDRDELTAGLTAYLALWHPKLLSASSELPRWAPVYELETDLEGTLILIPGPIAAQYDAEWEARALGTGATVIQGGTTLEEHLLALQEQLGFELPLDNASRNFMAIGLGRLWWLIATAHLGQEDRLSTHGAFADAVRQAARSASDDELPRAYEALASAVQETYPVETYTLAFFLLGDAGAPDVVHAALDRGLAINLLATGKEIQELNGRDPGLVQRLRAALEGDRADLVGGEWTETRHTLLPLDCLVRSIQRGREAYEQTLGRRPSAYGRRTFGLASYVPHILHRANIYYALHFSLDAATYPEHYEPKARWEGVATASLEALTREPLNLADVRDVLRYGRTLAQAMASDQVPTTAWVYQVGERPEWVDLVLRVAQFCPALGRWSTVTNYFWTTSPTDASIQAGDDRYRSAYLSTDQAVGHEHPVTRYTSRWRRHAQEGAYEFLRLIARQMRRDLPDAGGDELRERFYEAAKSLEGVLLRPASNAPPGYLILNPSPSPVTVTLASPSRPPFATRPLGETFAIDPTLRPPTGHGADAGYAEVPAFGFRWVSRRALSSTSTPLRVDHTEQSVIVQNGRFVLTVDRQTGLLRGFARPGDALPRIGCQLVASGFHAEPTLDEAAEPYAETPAMSRSRASCLRLSVEHETAEFVELVTEGMLIGEPPPAASLNGLITRFRISYQCWSEWDVVRLAVELWDMVEDLWDPDQSPWTQYIAARFAWPDPATGLVRGTGGLRSVTRQPRFEAPAFLELLDPPKRTVVLSAGLPFWVRSHRRMADLLLVTPTEKARFFELAIALDPPNPYRLLDQLLSPPLIIPTEGLEPRATDRGWFMHIDARNVHLVALEPLAEDGRHFRMRLLETSGQATRVAVRFWRPVLEAMMTDFFGEPLFQADTSGDTVEVDLLPHELVELEIRVK